MKTIVSDIVIAALFATGCADDTEVEPPCHALSVLECAERDDCETWDGRPYDESAQCFGMTEALACRPLLNCPPMIVMGRGPTGTLYAFHSGCLPTSWEEVNNIRVRYDECSAALPQPETR